MVFRSMFKKRDVPQLRFDVLVIESIIYKVPGLQLLHDRSSCN